MVSGPEQYGDNGPLLSQHALWPARPFHRQYWFLGAGGMDQNVSAPEPPQGSSVFVAGLSDENLCPRSWPVVLEQWAWEPGARASRQLLPVLASWVRPLQKRK